MALLPSHRPCCPAADTLRWRQVPFATPVPPQEAPAVQRPIRQPAQLCPVPQGLQFLCVRAFPHPCGALCRPCPQRPLSWTVLL